jgi:hypothetical protein
MIWLITFGIIVIWLACGAWAVWRNRLGRRRLAEGQRLRAEIRREYPLIDTYNTVETYLVGTDIDDRITCQITDETADIRGYSFRSKTILAALALRAFKNNAPKDLKLNH